MSLYGDDVKNPPDEFIISGLVEDVANRYRYMKTKSLQTITSDGVTATYGDTDITIDARVVVPATGGGAISYEVKEGFSEYIDVGASDGVLTIKKVPSDGLAYVTVTAAETDGYEKTSIDITVTINKADPEVTAPKANSLTYSGKAQELVTAGTTSGGEMQYALGTNDTAAPEGGWKTTIPKGTDAGTYYVWYKVVGGDNYNDKDPACVTVKIAAATTEHSITFDLNGGSLDGQTGKVTKKYNDGTVIVLPAPTRDGYEFDYWEGSKYNAGDKYTVSGDHTFKAVWKTSDPGSNGKSSVKKRLEV